MMQHNDVLSFTSSCECDACVALRSGRERWRNALAAWSEHKLTDTELDLARGEWNETKQRVRNLYDQQRATKGTRGNGE